MGHTCYNQFVHIVCATKDLTPLIVEGSKESLYSYIASIVKGLRGQFLARSGTSDHIHLLLNIPPDYSVSDILRQIKSCSSKWYRQQDRDKFDFAWTEGYFAFTVSPDSLDNIKEYFLTENKRHETISVKDELIKFLNLQEILFNPQYVLNTTHARLIYHLIWSVKNRENLLDKSLQKDLHEQIKNEVKDAGGKLYAVGNVTDHIHLLVESPKNLATANLVLKLKTTTTNFLRTQSRKLREFSWQEGYGVFSVGKPALNAVMNYVNDQENHHRLYSFEDEWQRIVGCRPSGA